MCSWTSLGSVVQSQVGIWPPDTRIELLTLSGSNTGALRFSFSTSLEEYNNGGKNRISDGLVIDHGP